MAPSIRAQDGSTVILIDFKAQCSKLSFAKCLTVIAAGYAGVPVLKATAETIRIHWIAETPDQQPRPGIMEIFTRTFYREISQTSFNYGIAGLAALACFS